MNPLGWLKRALLNDGPVSEPRPDEIVVLAEATDAAEAGLWAEILNRNGVHCVAVDAGYVAFAGTRQPAWRVLVAYRDIARARELIGLGDGAG